MKSKREYDMARPVDSGSYDNGWVYEDADGDKLLWSNKSPLPELGTKIKVTMNSIGPAFVVGYFAEASTDKKYVGVMTVPTNPPKWLRDQVKRGYAKAERPLWYRVGVGCIYGSEAEV